jgi:RNA polymerase sigma factor (sigma-70 family)
MNPLTPFEVATWSPAPVRSIEKGAVGEVAERSLIERARTDRTAFALLYRRYYGTIGRYLFARTGDAHATEDLLSETFLAALRGLATYRAGRIPFRWWLYRIATNAANRRLRRLRRGEVMLDSADELPDRNADGRDPLEADHVRALLKRLKPRHAEVLVLHYLEELELAEIAAVLGCRLGTVKSRLDRARRELRRITPEARR